jgi:peptide/nickel transport system permease protein
MKARSKSLAAAGRRLLQVGPVIVLATLIVFALMHIVPGDPAVTLAGEEPTAERIAEIRQLYGFDRPFLVQYWSWLSAAVQGDLSKSLLSSESVATLIAQNFPNTLVLVFYALIISLVIGLPLGIAAATRQGSPADAAISAVSSVGIAMPHFWLGMILVTYFALSLSWFPATGAGSITTDFSDAIWRATLPALALASGGIAEVARQSRSALIEVLSSQFVRTLRAKGLSTTSIFWKHGLKNIGVTLLTVTGLLFNRLLGATVVVEAIFAYPGMGNLIVRAAINKDFPVVQGVVLSMVIVVVITNLAIDILYGVIDPRVKQK